MPIRPKFKMADVEKYVADKLARIEREAIGRLRELGLSCITMARGNDQNNPSAFPITYSDSPNPQPLKQRKITERDLGRNPAVKPPPYGDFLDYTGNLRSSISFFIIKDGKIIEENLGAEGTETAYRIARERAAEMGRGLGLVVVAGQSYAIHVESKGYDVLSSAELYAKLEASKIKDQIKKNVYGLRRIHFKNILS